MALVIDVTEPDLFVRRALEMRAAQAAATRRRGPLAPYRRVGDPGEPGFASGWSNAGSGTPPLSYYRDTAGGVFFGGCVQSTYGAAASIVTLPPEMRPPGHLIMTCQSIAAYELVANPLGPMTATVAVLTDGTVQPIREPWAAATERARAGLVSAAPVGSTFLNMPITTWNAGDGIDIASSTATVSTFAGPWTETGLYATNSGGSGALTLNRPTSVYHEASSQISIKTSQYFAFVSYTRLWVWGHWRAADVAR